MAILVLLSCKTGPPQPNTSPVSLVDNRVVTVAAVQGGGDSAFANASEFLTGCGDNLQEVPPFGTCSKPVMHLPQALQNHARHLHLNGMIKDYSPFYLDERVKDGSGALGQDSDIRQGLEGANVIFYSGHGHLDNFHALSNSEDKTIQISDFSLGDHDARYLLMLSCNVFAHGPSSNGDFSHPEGFQATRIGSVTAGGHANVFERWTRLQRGVVPLNPGLRLACGGASHIGSALHPTAPLWNYYSLQGFGPADAFLLGLYTPESAGVPLCISRGNRAEVSGLFDSRFMADPPGNGNHIFIEYPMDAGRQDSLLAEATKASGVRYARQRDSQTGDPAGLPVLVVDPAPTPSFLDGVNFSKAPLLSYGFRGSSAASLPAKVDFLSVEGTLSAGIGPGDVCIKSNGESGAVILSLRAEPDAGFLTGDSGSALLERMASKVIRSVVGTAGVHPGNSGDGFILRDGQPIEMRIDGVPAERNRLGELNLNELSHARKCRHLRLTRVYRSNGKDAPVIGEGGEVLFSICPTLGSAGSGGAGNVADACHRTSAPQLSVSIAGRSLKEPETASEFAFPTLDAGRQEALKRLFQRRDGSSYDPAPTAARWGYKAAPLHCRQERMYIVYEFEFAPNPGLSREELPPILIEVPAHKLPAPFQRVEDTWTCDPEIQGRASPSQRSSSEIVTSESSV